jgi:hypothetical protein
VGICLLQERSISAAISVVGSDAAYRPILHSLQHADRRAAVGRPDRSDGPCDGSHGHLPKEVDSGSQGRTHRSGGGTDCLGVLVVVPCPTEQVVAGPVRRIKSGTTTSRSRTLDAGCLRRSVLSIEMTRLSAAIA